MRDENNDYVYIAGPYSQGDIIRNIRNAIDAADKLAREGYTPYIPHLLYAWHMIIPHDAGFWRRQGLNWVSKCNYLLRLPGKSDGADAEVCYAQLLGIPVYTSIDSLLEADK